jgi:hypothetical protein
LQQFRADVYQQALGQRKDSLFELLEAALGSLGAAPLVRLSLAPAFRRRWPSGPDALADGSLHLDPLRALLVAALPPPRLRERRADQRVPAVGPFSTGIFASTPLP